MNQIGTHSSTSQRFVVLDSWRGLFALLVAAFHFPLSGPLSQTAFLRHSYLFVDFFFVLSGFVIAHAYAQKLAGGQGLAKFLVTRFGRLAPLHLFMLAVLIGLEMLRWLVPAFSNGNPAFSGRNTVEGIVVNLTLLQGFGLTDVATWNTPSWSISTELTAYLVFGLTLSTFGRYGLKAMAIIALLSPLALWIWSPHLLDVTDGFALLRCLYGFAFGTIVYQLHARIQPNADGQVAGAFQWTLAEIAILFAVGDFIILGGDERIGLAAPIMFALAILVFVNEGGLVSRLLKTRPFTAIGALSYSIYMVHMTVQAVFYASGHFAHRRFGWAEIPKLEIEGIDLYELTLAQDVLLLGLMLALTIAASFFTYKVVEMPANRWFRHLASRLPASRHQAIHSAA